MCSFSLLLKARSSSSVEHLCRNKKKKKKKKKKTLPFYYVRVVLLLLSIETNTQRVYTSRHHRHVMSRQQLRGASSSSGEESQSLLQKGTVLGALSGDEERRRGGKKSTRGFANALRFHARVVSSGVVMFTILSSLILVSFTTGYRSVDVHGKSLMSGGGGSSGGVFAELGGGKKKGSSLGHKSHAHHRGRGAQHVIDVPFADDSDKHNYKASHGGKGPKSKKKNREENCDPAEADMAKGIFAYSDPECLNGETAGCSGDPTSGNPSTCRFCNTLMAQVKTPTWATCPQSVCKKHGVMGCEGDSVEDLEWKSYVDDIRKHNKRVEQIGITSACEGTPADRELGRFMFHDAKCGEKLLPACDGNQMTQCRFCSAAKKATAVSMTWPTCPDVVCARWGVKMDHCELPLAMYQLPTKRAEKNRKTNEFPEPRVDNVKTEKLHKKSWKDAEDLIASEDANKSNRDHMPRSWRMGDDYADMTRVAKNFITKT